MSIDLQHTLADLAGSVHDEALVTRLTAQVGPMVGRIRRRRAARAAAVGAASMGTVAAMTVGAVALANRGGNPTPGPATEAPAPPAPVTHDGEALECADAVPDALVSDAALAVAGETPATTEYGSDLMTTLRWWAPGDEEVRYSGASVDMAVARNGLVVGVATSDWPTDESELVADEITLGSTETGTLGAFASQLPVTPCGGDTPLDAGEYQVIATVTLTSGDGDTWHASAGPWPLTIEPAPVPGEVGTDADAAAAAQAQAAVQEIIAASTQVTAEQPFGTCGTIVPTPSDDDPLSLELDLDSGTGMLYAPGDLVDGVTIVTPAGGRPSVVGDFPDVGATVVLAKDGVVVGRGPQAEYGPLPLEITEGPEGAQVLYGTGEVQLCSLPGADAPTLDLPAGLYEAYAVMPVTLQEVTEADGTTHPASGSIVVRSQPVDVIVQAPRD